MKKTTLWLALSFFIAVTAACTSTNKTGTTDDSTMHADSMGTDTTGGMMGMADKAHADISATKTDTAGSGTAQFTKKDDGTVELSLNVKFPKMANKTVAVHLHEHGDCGDAGKGAHGHWNPTNEAHGKWGSAAYHSGDIGNVQLDAEGSGSVTVSSDRWTIGGDDKTNILGRAVIVHSGVDDYTTQPTGNAGSRIGCGVISGN
ncbi:MAG: superoxide dismutase family protein [Daejeonella sp.]|uniref:superoxide dismutase family protein n=1 Tax=Daejeonella sp. JGW-45 TaxID=3034148 RepID=UPI0023EAEC76|nr:superoxide dismutase family protein [Daejeonella sp. JGW-45]